MSLVAAHLRKATGCVDLEALATQTAVKPHVLNSYLIKEVKEGQVQGQLDWSSRQFIPAAVNPGANGISVASPAIGRFNAPPDFGGEKDMEVFLTDVRALYGRNASAVEGQTSLVKGFRIFIPIFFAGIWTLCWLTMPFEVALAATIETGIFLPLMLLLTWVPQLQKKRAANFISLATEMRFSELITALSDASVARDRATRVHWPLKGLVNKKLAQLQPTFDLEGFVLEQMKLNDELQGLCNQLTFRPLQAKRAEILEKINELFTKSEAHHLRIHPVLEKRIKDNYN